MERLENDLDRQIRVGICGFGVVGQKRAQILRLMEGVELCAVCDIKMFSSVSPLQGVLCFKTPMELLSVDLDCVFICMTNDLNPAVCIESLKRGLHVFCEKPPAVSIAELDQVIDVESQFPELILQYGFNHRFHDSVLEALAIRESGTLGELININGVYGKSNLVTFDQSDWRTQKNIAGGGILLDQGIHMLDLMRLFVADEFVEIKSCVSNKHWGFEVEDNAFAIMRSTKGIIAMLHSSATQWKHKFWMQLSFEMGSIILDGLLTSSKSYGRERLSVLTTNDLTDEGNPPERVAEYKSDPSWQREISSFIECVRRSDPQLNKCNSREARATLRLVEDIYAADSFWHVE